MTATPALGNVEKDVQERLLSSRQRRRKQGEVPYPFEHSSGMVDYDIWEHMFFVSTCRGLTMHRFDHPPESVLDLGCGSGYWALEAAKLWTSSTIVGFDIARIQPNLQELKHYRHLADRVKWAHGNLLDGLPFPSSQFDFVRVAYIGLGVPEDEWQSLLEEISRVMKPGAVLEVIEEDIIFPCTTISSEPSLSPKLSDLDLSFRSLGYSESSNAMLLDPNSCLPERKHPSSPLRTMYQGFTRRTGSKTQLSTMASQSSFNSQISGTSKAADISMAKKHPQDHTRIRTAWESMLSSRFICPKILSVLPFYLSTFFSDIKTHPPYQVPLPPNSSSQPPLRVRHSAESFRPSSRGGSATGNDSLDPLSLAAASPRSFRRTDGTAVRSMYFTKGFDVSQRSSSMHLSRAVNTITACKDPIWREYQTLFHQEYVDQYSQTDVSLRHLFDRDWNSWINDMTDRMSLRDRIGVGLAWPETPGDKPECRKWRSEFDSDLGTVQDQEPPPKMYHDPNDLCRSMRVFVAKKTS